MADTSSGGLDPRFPTAYQRGGESTADAAATSARPSAPRTSSPQTRAPQLDDDVAVSGVAPALARPVREDDGARHFEVVIAGNPWLRALWAVGALALFAALGLAVYAEYAFSAAQSEGAIGPDAYLAPRIAQTLVLPLSIAGVIALVAAMVLRIVAWRPSGARELEAP